MHGREGRGNVVWLIQVFLNCTQQNTECLVLCLQAERIMEAVELCKEEQAKLAEHREKCAAARKEVGASSVPW